MAPKREASNENLPYTEFRAKITAFTRCQQILISKPSPPLWIENTLLGTLRLGCLLTASKQAMVGIISVI